MGPFGFISEESGRFGGGFTAVVKFVNSALVLEPEYNVS